MLFMRPTMLSFVGLRECSEGVVLQEGRRVRARGSQLPIASHGAIRGSKDHLLTSILPPMAYGLTIDMLGSPCWQRRPRLALRVPVAP